MTDARFPDRWLNDRRILRLTDSEFRSFVVSLAWSVSNRTDGRIERDDLDMIPTFRHVTVTAFVTRGLWVEDGSDSWQIADFDVTQTTAAQLDGLEQRRVNDRERQARKRARARGQDPDPSRDSQRDVTQDIQRDTKARLGQARTGKEPSALPPPPGPGQPDHAPVPEAPPVRCRVCGERLTTQRAKAVGLCNKQECYEADRRSA